jgi:hypothetical protein
MPFPELDPYRHQLPQLSNALTQLESYLSEVFARPTRGGFDHAAHDIAPIQVANRLEVDEGLALVLLNCFKEAGIIDQHYDVYCPVTELFVDRFSSKTNLPAVIRCPFEVATEHTIDDYLVELVFSFSSRFVERHRMAV